jgi:hypothetical protein
MGKIDLFGGADTAGLLRDTTWQRPLTRQQDRRSQRFPHCAPMHSSIVTQG